MSKTSLILIPLLLLSSNIPAQDETLIVHAEILSVTNIRYADEESISELADGTITISNACGRYIANAKIKEVLVGYLREPEIEIIGSIGEWCRPVLSIFPNDYIFELRQEPEGFLNIDHITLYETSDGGLAASPMSLDFAVENNSDVEFMDYVDDLTFRPADLDGYGEDVDQSWFLEKDGYLDLVKGVKYEALRKFITSNKSIPE